MITSSIDKNYTKVYSRKQYVKVYPTKFVVRIFLLNHPKVLKKHGYSIFEVGFGDGRSLQ